MTVVAMYFMGSLSVLGGLLIIFKEAGWPSERERKNTLLRSVISAAGGTLSATAVILLLLHTTEPGSFFVQWSAPSIVLAIFLIAVPIFLLLTLGWLIQFSIWEHNRPKWEAGLGRIIRSQAGDSGDNNKSTHTGAPEP